MAIFDPHPADRPTGLCGSPKGQRGHPARFKESGDRASFRLLFDIASLQAVPVFGRGAFFHALEGVVKRGVIAVADDPGYLFHLDARVREQRMRQFDLGADHMIVISGAGFFFDQRGQIIRADVVFFRDQVQGQFLRAVQTDIRQNGFDQQGAVLLPDAVRG